MQGLVIYFADKKKHVSPVWSAQKANLSFNKFPYISVIDEDSDFKFFTQLTKAHHRTPPEEKSVWRWWLPFNISATAEASDFKFGK